MPADRRQPKLMTGGGSNRSDLALVLTGGGSRAAYQVGFLRALARECPDFVPDVLTGVSAGGINAAFLAAHQEPFIDKVENLARVWSDIRIDDVFRVDLRDLASRTLRWGGRLLSGGQSPLPPARSMVDTAPLRGLLERVLHARAGAIDGIARTLQSGLLQAIALTASSYTTGQSITWVQSYDEARIATWERPLRKSLACELRVDHVMASSALPFFFPAVEVDGAWYGDGGIRLTAPLSPAVHLGARRIIAVSTRYLRSREEADRPAVIGYPPPAQVAGVLYNAIFLDQLDADALHMQQVNRFIARLPPAERDGLRHIDLLVLRPSEDLGRLANAYEPELPRAFRFLTRGLGTRETRSNDMLSLVMFQKNYVRRLIEIGEADAQARIADIRRFLSDGGTRL
ncbi:MAG TPA: patatin-like phospholipase family protein [Vicinamibacterales bacterium]|jgi:NTE family protein|nr:patatin-like phospholipase family protein [Vicinamibacterales bacterium]